MMKVKDTKKDKKEKVEKKSKVVEKIKEKVKKNNKTSYGFVEVLIFSFVFMLFGIVLGFLLSYGKDPYTGKKMSKSMEEFISTYENIKENYYGELDEQKLIDAAISGMVNSIDDPYSSYMDEESTDAFNEEITGSYVGIGVTVDYSENTNKVIDVSKDDAADKAGIKVGDIIIKVDDNDVSNTFGDDLSNLIRGEEGTKVKVTVKRGEEVIDFNITRSKINIISVTSKVVNNNDKKVGVIKVQKFSSNTYSQFEKELKKLEKDNIDSLVIDVRDNLGGQLSQARKILNLFFDKKTVLFQMKSSDETVKVKGSDNKTRDYPVAIIINNSSASASEVVAACFKDNYKNAYIVGDQSFGKGTVQKTVSLKSGSKIKYTVQKWLTPKGDWIEGEGIKPKYKVSNDEDYYNNPTDENDKQLKKAIELVSK